MPTYANLVRWTDQGIQNYKDSAATAATHSRAHTTVMCTSRSNTCAGRVRRAGITPASASVALVPSEDLPDLLPFIITAQQHFVIPGTQCDAEQGALKTRWPP